MAKTTKQALIDWEEYAKNIRASTPVLVENETDKSARIKMLLRDWEKFAKYYFPQYCTAEFAPFHKKIAKATIDNDSIYLVAALAREHGKSVLLGLILPLFLKFNKKLHNMLLVSHSYDNAEELLMPIMLNLENNRRILNDFGVQKGFRQWEMGKFFTKDGCSFRALGAKQSPRGSRNEEKRPDFILIDDIDTDVESRNQKRIDDKWKWIEQALFPAMSVKGTKRFVFAGNIISKESTIVKASRVADLFIKVNILDKNGQPSWSRYILAEVNYMISKMSYASAQKEYFNNPITEGTVFTNMKWGRVPALSKFKFLVCYTDPSYKTKGDYKATVLLGALNGFYYIIKARVEQTTTAKMIQWHYDLWDFVAGKVPVYFYLEANFIQDVVHLPEFKKVARKAGRTVPISSDKRKKPDKFSRIEANLEPLNSQGQLILNEAERKCPHMLRLKEQFEAIEPTLSAHDDGPDAVEGGVWIVNHKLRGPTNITVGTQRRSKHKY